MSIDDDIFDLTTYLEQTGHEIDDPLTKPEAVEFWNSIMKYINTIEADNQELRAENTALKEVLTVANGIKITEAGMSSNRYIHLELVAPK